MNRLNDVLGSIEGMKIPGGCDECDAYQVAYRDDEHPQIWHVDVYHDDACPFLHRNG